MSTPVLATKLYIPPPRPKVVPRPRLIERLNEGHYRKLTLISAPAGFGKTTLVSAWLHQSKGKTAWLSLDESENDPTRFLAYLIAALQTITPTIGEGVLAMIQAPQPAPTESILTALLNDIITIPDNSLLILDDYHVIEADAVDQALTFLLDHLPPQLHLVITTREDPPLPLARYRVRGQMTELRTADLRFTAAEAATFLNQVMGLNLSAEEITTLESRTEGWIAGLQMAALSMQGRADTATFIQAFTGSHRFVLDYLVEEVVQRQPERVRSFLLQTSILDRLSGPLCDAVTGQEDGRGMLAALERDNLFIVPLDDERQWYRYHHLFADVLQARLMEEQPNQAPDLHRQASQWYEQHDLPADAIRHAFSAEDFERAASLVQRAWPVMRQIYHEATLLGWIRTLPDELLHARPVLNVHYAVALLPDEPDTAETHLREAERWLDTMTDTSERSDAQASKKSVAQMVVVNEEEIRSLPGMIAFARAYQAGALRNISNTVKYAQQALELLPEGNYLYRGSAAVLLGLAQWTSGDLETAHRSITNSLSSMQMSGDISAAISALYILADIRLAQGHLRQANGTSQQALKLAAEHGKPVPQGTADVYVVLSELHREQGDLEAARQHLLTSKKLGEHAALQVARHRWSVAMARIKEAQGDLDSALDLLDEAERLQIGNPAPDVRPIAALKARVWVRQGRLTKALGWAREQGVSVDDELNYLREFEHITLARILIAQYARDRADWAIFEAMGLLERLLKAAEEGKRMGSVIEILILQALVYHLQGDIPTALVPLQQALKLAEPEGYVRLFVDKGAPMTHLLHEAISRGITPDYARQLLDGPPPTRSEQDGQSLTQSKTPSSQSPIIEPLSERELEVLQYIAQGFTNQEIADRLYLSLYTVKAHARNIYSKLGVNNRTQAVTKARESGLLPHS